MVHHQNPRPQLIQVKLAGAILEGRDNPLSHTFIR
jgi:hypothetical protein